MWICKISTQYYCMIDMCYEVAMIKNQSETKETGLHLYESLYFKFAALKKSKTVDIPDMCASSVLLICNWL